MESDITAMNEHYFSERENGPRPRTEESINQVVWEAISKIENNFRHTETDKTPIETDVHVDYLFHRLFALIWMVLQMRSI